MFRIARRSRLIAGLAVAGAVALVPAATSSAAEAPAAKAPQAAAVQKGGAPAADRKVSPQQKRKAMAKLNRMAKRAGLERSSKGVGRGYYVSNGYACFFAPQWNYRICFSYQYGSGDYQVFAWGDNVGRSGMSYIGTLEVFLYGIGG